MVDVAINLLIQTLFPQLSKAKLSQNTFIGVY